MTIVFSNDPDRIAALRAMREECRPEELLERFFRELPTMYSIGEADAALLKDRRDEAVPRLLEIAERDRAETLVGAMAIQALAMLEEPAVAPIARRALREPKATWRHMVTSREAAFLGTDPEIRRRLLAGLDSPDRGEAASAVQECGAMGIAGALERFIEWIGRPDAPDRSRLAFWIGRMAPSPASVAVIESAWLDESTAEEEDYWFLTAIGNVIREGSSEARRAAVGVLLRWLAEVRDGVRAPRGSPGSGAVADVLGALRSVARDDPRCAEEVAACLRAGSPAVLVFVQVALDVVAAGAPPLHRAMAMEMLQRSDVRIAGAAAGSLGTAYEGIGDVEVVAAIRAARVQHGPASVFDEALAKVGGDDADAAAEAGLDGSAPSMSRMRILWRTRKIDPQAALDRLAALGALGDAGGLAEAAFASRRKNWPDREPEPADVFLDALVAAGVLVGFDMESDQVPSPHDRLILRLSEATRGRFVVEAARQVWNLPPGATEADDLDEETVESTDYTVEFLHDGRIVVFRAQYRGGWYDADAVAVAFNEALRKAGRDERFHPLISEDQDLNLLLLAPVAARIAREEFHVPLTRPPRVRGRRGP